ncbi:hypothetical protein IEO21_09870 [Rhodonia placenta]|uniref:Uncharacterized protein n=1 Tax=Rhodonia placenta TaxID=104341 RepID=A0A8H7NTI1_9APHY|nr:hypothetical protein IEO21_09870 [Postia placenta]
MPVLLLGLVPVGTNLYALVAFPQFWSPKLQQCRQHVMISPEQFEACSVITDYASQISHTHTTVPHDPDFKAAIADIGASRWAISFLNVYALIWYKSTQCHRLSSILVGRFLLHIRLAASRRNASSGSQDDDSQSAADTATLETRSWISSVEFIMDIGDDNDQTCNADLFSDDEDANVQEQDEEPVAMSVTQC